MPLEWIQRSAGNNWCVKWNLLWLLVILCRQCQTKNATSFHQQLAKGKITSPPGLFRQSEQNLRRTRAVVYLFFIFFMKNLAASWGRRGNLNKPRGFWVCKWCVRLHSHQPGGPEERDGAAGAGQEGQRPLPCWFASFAFYWFLFWIRDKNGCKHKQLFLNDCSTLSQLFFLTPRLPLALQFTSQTSQQIGKRSCSRSFRSTRSWPRRTTRTTSGIRRLRRCSRLKTARKQSFVAFTSNAMISNGEPVKKLGKVQSKSSLLMKSCRSNHRASAAAGGGSYRQEN